MKKVINYRERLIIDFASFEDKMFKLIEVSTIEELKNNPNSQVFFIEPTYRWGKTNDAQKLLQKQLLTDYANWKKHFHLLIRSASAEVNRQFEEIDKFIISWIEKKSDWEIPKSNDLAKSVFKEKVAIVYDLINLFTNGLKDEIIIVPDTNSIISIPELSSYAEIAGQKQFTVLFIPPVLSELDKLKNNHRDLEFREKVNSVINRIKGYRKQGNLKEGVIVNKTITVKMIATEPNFRNTLDWLDHENMDDRIIACVLEVQIAHPTSTVIISTSDINLQNKAEMANLNVAEPPTKKEGK